MSLREPLMLVFFTTVGLGASFKLLREGGPKVLRFLIIASLFLVAQNGIGIFMAWLTDLHPAFGLIGGSVTLTGGHATGVTWSESFNIVHNLQGTVELAMACATFGLVLGGLVGSPVAQMLIKKHNLKSAEINTDGSELITFDVDDEDRVTPMSVMKTLWIIAACIVAGNLFHSWYSGLNTGFNLPSFVCSLMIGIIVTNFLEITGLYNIRKECLDLLGTIGLSLFLAMSLMSLRLWELVHLAGPMLLILGVQTITVALFAYFVTFRLMGSNYDAAVIAGGHCGFGLGATPTAVANMEALTSRYGPSSQAFLVVPMVGAFFIDVINAIIIASYYALPLFKV
jgi:ESS family glutamate:Na+ symporter